jgi:hypothetical protein
VTYLPWIAVSWLFWCSLLVGGWMLGVVVTTDAFWVLVSGAFWVLVVLTVLRVVVVVASSVA